ncbi:hypothetical protein EV138_3932 [Kribbella voronezhensis]|uniref:Uncharacterized protein n=1 Tax=Kribbella voronezhensis TaxID=2512212 RepID=A0A4R7TFK9_9ACTN|nr:hypothetical protein [Kribbella voronezhensis]TDU90346.1 hypothetical protein EV138_3932 [Kribbella voronezhensis]
MADQPRTIMIQDWFTVPAVPDETLRSIYGQRTPDPRVEFVALTVEYYVRAQAVRSLTRTRVLDAMRGRITADNVWDLVRLLARLGLAEEFFALAALEVDRDSAFRGFLLGLDPILMDAIRHYSFWNTVNPKLFFEGFVVGVAASYATVVVDLVKLLQLVGRLQNEGFSTLYLLATEPDAGLNRLDEQVAVVKQVFSALLDELDPTTLPAKLLKVWRDWNREFEHDLENLDWFAAGKRLGRIAGDLYQLLVGIAELMALLKVAVKAAIRYAPLLVGVLRGAAAQLALLTRQLAAVLIAIGKAVIEAAPRVGMDLLRTLFPPEVLRPLIREGRAFLAQGELTLSAVFQAAHAEAFAGAGAGTGYGVLVSQNNKPVFMAATSELVSSAGRQATRAELDQALDAILAKLDEAFAPLLKPATPANLSTAVTYATRAGQLARRLTTQLNGFLQQVAYAAFVELRKLGRVNPGQLGQIIHRAMEIEVAKLIGEVAPGVLPITEKTLKVTLETIKSSAPELGPLLTRADRALGRTIAQMLLEHPDRELLLKLVGFDAKGAADTERALASHLSKRFGWKTTTTVGDLKSDLLLLDPNARRVTNVDWTSSTKLEKFEETWGKVAEDLGGEFDGNWEAIADAYVKAGKGGVPAEVVKGLEELTTHAVRETVVRQAALQSVFGELFYVLSHEMTYKGLNSLFK